MSDIRQLADQIRQRQLAAASTGTEKALSDPEKQVSTSKRAVGSGSLKEELLQCGQGEQLGHMIHIRLSSRDYRKLIALGAARISAQKLSLYAIRQLLDHPEIKAQLKEIFHDLD